MTLTSVSSGSLACSSVETNIFSDSTENFVYTMVKMYFDPMASGDTIVIKIYDWDKISASYKLYITKTLNGAQPNPVYFFPAIPAHRIQASLTQTAGTNRTINWERLQG